MTQAPSTLRSRILKGAGAQAFGQVVQIFIRLSEVPLLLAFWGTQLYGEWLMLSAIPAYLAIGDGGFATAACRDMTMKSGAGDRQGTVAVFQSTWLLLLTVSLVAFALAYGFAMLTPFDQWLGFSVMPVADTRIAFLLLVAHVLVGFQGGLLDGGFWVSGKYPAGMALGAFTQLLEFFGLAIAVSLGGGPVQAAIGYVSGRILGTSLVWLGQRKASPWLRHGFKHATFSELKRLTAPAFASLAFPLGNALNIQGMRLVVGLVLGPAAVAVFTPLRTLGRFAMQPRGVIDRILQPELATAFGKSDLSLFRRLFTKSSQFAFWGCLIACLFVGAGGYWFFPIWTSGKVFMDWPTFILLLSATFVNGIWFIALMVPYATNRHGWIAVSYSAIYGVIGCGLGYFGAIFFGLAGAALGLLLVEITMAVIVVRSALLMTGVGMTEWVWAVFRPPHEAIAWAIAGFKKWIVTTML